MEVWKMKKLITERELDELGRVTIPIEIRRNLGLNELDLMECYENNENYIVLKKVSQNKDGAVRRLDRLGRYTIPIEIRKNARYRVYLDDECRQILLKGISVTNADDIRQMTNEELAGFIYNEQECGTWKNEREVLAWLREKGKSEK